MMRGMLNLSIIHWLTSVINLLSKAAVALLPYFCRERKYHFLLEAIILGWETTSTAFFGDKTSNFCPIYMLKKCPSFLWVAIFIWKAKRLVSSYCIRHASWNLTNLAPILTTFLPFLLAVNTFSFKSESNLRLQNLYELQFYIRGWRAYHFVINKKKLFIAYVQGNSFFYSMSAFRVPNDTHEHAIFGYN